MAADTLTISLPAPLADEVRAAAKARGLTPEDYVREQIKLDLEADAAADNLDWEEDLRRLEEPGENVPLDEAFDRFKANIAEARAKTK